MNDQQALVFASPRGQILAQVLDAAPASLRFMQRAGKLGAVPLAADRAGLLARIASCLCTDEERAFNRVAVLSIRQRTEQSFWGCLAYHCFREYGEACSFHPMIEESSGDFTLLCRTGQPVLKLVVPRVKVRAALALLSSVFPGQEDLVIHPVLLKSIFKVTQSTRLDLEVRPLIQMLQETGEARFFDREEMERFTYGDLVYLKEMRILAELEQPGRERRFASPVSMKLRKSQVPAFDNLVIFERRDHQLSADGRQIRVSAIDLLGFTSSARGAVQVGGTDRRAEIVKWLLALTPSKPLGRLKGMVSPLRSYQRSGVEWLKFLCEHRLGGLLCDDMGLGKTHQAMALMLWLKEQRRAKRSFLVVCPTTVMSHWLNKIRDHAPRLKAVIYHGGQRDMKRALRKGNLLITSYGVLRNDIAELKRSAFLLAVFDEIQNLKNRETQSYQAACALEAEIKVGLMGTPIENSLAELKWLFDLVLPGYLGTDEEFTTRYGIAAHESGNASLGNLRRLISPFVLRRLKSAVLDELPEKIEDVRTCKLSEAQVKLYREALSTKGASLVDQIKARKGPLPYIHIFALLNLLKRICAHPALALGRTEEYQAFESGKWELFQELLFESLDSGQKVVVFTQYLGMVAIMEQLLRSLDIGHVSLTGASESRGEILRRFNEDRDCRVYVGSLKAGGTGIDLVAGSVVIHYDRWWNAAREDQATDRVYRIGQNKAVQVFKLITEGTLEEKIAAIIERKRRLMNTVVQADDPHLKKIFTPEELLDLLQPV